MAKYAAQTEVSTEKSRAEIERILSKYGARRFAYMQDETQAAIVFEVNNRRIRFILPLPDRTSDDVVKSRHANQWQRYTLSIDKQHERFEQLCRQRWRALKLAIQAKLEAVESGIAEFEQEFMAYVVLPNGQTVGEFVGPQIAASYETQAMPKMLPGIGETGPAN